ncbi:MAG: glycosyltransferase family 2 protein [Thermoflexales bacterium]|nr:glycosyltransferase family 2 protein [Thermoflexales bacterium]MDW8352681.1 glycosyltransferase family 2 protein [Anaerolineae bacterium]
MTGTHPPRISAVVLTLNEARHIVACLDTLAWADERVVFDSFSTDATVALAREAGARVIQHPFENYAQQRNAALSAVESDWVFFVDADERCPEALGREIRAVVEAAQHDVYCVPRQNYLFGRLTLGAGWHPDYQARLFRVGRARFDPRREVHEVAQYDGAPGYLRNALIHYNYDTLAQFHAKQRKYAQFEAGILFKQGVRPKPRNFVLQPLREFRRRFFALRGYRDGWHGLRLSLLMAYYNFDTYRRLARLWRDQTSDRPPSTK